MIIDEVDDSFVLTLTRFDNRYAADGAAKSGRRPTGLYGKFPAGLVKTRENIAFDINNWRLTPPQLLDVELCALPTWWFWRSGCTRSHSEHGRETLQRRWYFDLSHGRVGRCQVCKTQISTNLQGDIVVLKHDTLSAYARKSTGRPQSGPLSL
jgi:hypothetical protein